MDAEARILIVEDDPLLARLITREAEKAGWRTRHAPDARTALGLAGDARLILLDRILPDLDGAELCRTLKSRQNTPILMLTGKTGEENRVSGLDAGADDYLEKPFSFPELFARIRALLRRADPAQITPALRLCPELCAVRAGGRQIELTKTEYALFALLASNRGQIFPRTRLLGAVWGAEDITSRCVDVTLARLRAKFAPADFPIVTVRGAGYLFPDKP